MFKELKISIIISKFLKKTLNIQGAAVATSCTRLFFFIKTHTMTNTKRKLFAYTYSNSRYMQVVGFGFKLLQNQFSVIFS